LGVDDGETGAGDGHERNFLGFTIDEIFDDVGEELQLRHEMRTAGRMHLRELKLEHRQLFVNALQNSRIDFRGIRPDKIGQFRHGRTVSKRTRNDKWVFSGRREGSTFEQLADVREQAIDWGGFLEKIDAERFEIFARIARGVAAEDENF
jgi:hypothetical protein